MTGIRRPRPRSALALLLVVLAAALAWALTRRASPEPRVPVAAVTIPTLQFAPQKPGTEFSPGAVGLSVDANELSAGRLSVHDASLVRLMQLLGPSLLRIGGDSVDLSWWTSSDEPSPRWATTTTTPADLYTLREMLDATGWHMLLGVDFAHFEPTRAANEALEAQSILGPLLVGVEIGNEPNDYAHESNGKPLRGLGYRPPEYIREADAYKQALNSQVPSLAIYGPASSNAHWLTAMGGAAQMFSVLTDHFYPMEGCSSDPSTGAPLEPTSTALLSSRTRLLEEETLSELAQARALTSRATLIGETGAGACRGNSSASPVFASALWSLGWVLRAASGGVAGLNFHGHLGVCGPYTQSPICAPTAQAAHANQVTAQPVYYGMLAATRLEGGQFIPTSLSGVNSADNIETWATLAPSGTVTIAIDDLSLAGPAQPLFIPMSGYSAAEEPMLGPSPNARSHISLGRAGITDHGRWHPRPIRLRSANGYVRVLVHPASALLITLRPH
jgi:hypothetical protein